MKCGKGTCAECGRSVLTLEGRAVKHPAPGVGYDCDGGGEPVAQQAARAASPPPPPSRPRVEPSTARPAAAPAKALRPREAAVVAVPPAVMKAARIRATHSRGPGSIDMEALARCDCPSLAAAIRRHLGRG